jgi:molybdopterin molybdotransferase
MTMISIKDACGMVIDNLPPRQVERIPFQTAQGRVLAEDLHAGMDIPPFNRAAVDGYALRSADVISLPRELVLAGEVRAGGAVTATLASCQAMAITTGAPIPAGADAVQMIEHVQVSPDARRITVLQGIEPGQNIVPCGYEATRGALVLEAGRALGPAEIAVLATFGCTEVSVWRRPRVAVLVTGDELVEVDREPRNGQIRNSNAYSLTAQLHCLGIEPDYLGIALDDPLELRRKVAEGLSRDVLIISGGASVGTYDFVKTVFQEVGVEIFFAQVALRPGKPTVFGHRGKTLVFGLPGNPVSSFVSFETFVRPALGRMCGLARPDLQCVEGELQRTMRQIPGRTAFLPAVASWERGGWQIDPQFWKGSGDIISFSRANALVVFPRDRDLMDRGAKVEALLLPDYFMRRP